MKKTIVFIIILLLMVAACLYYNCMQKEKFELDKKEAVAAAVQRTIDSLDQRHVLETPPQSVKAHKPPPPEPIHTPEPEQEATGPDMLLDARDGQEYKVFEANGQWWMGENLNFETTDSWCYNLDKAGCDSWGRLYTWDIATSACPEGWHLPNDQEWLSLINYYGGVHYAGTNFKVGGASDFNALMSGYRDKAGFFGKVDESAYYWSSTTQNDEYASFKGIYSNVSNIGTYTYTKTDGLSVRCVKSE
jgi:uncharacterized protein (TIGR02145 family)